MLLGYAGQSSNLLFVLDLIRVRNVICNEYMGVGTRTMLVLGCLSLSNVNFLLIVMHFSSKSSASLQ